MPTHEHSERRQPKLRGHLALDKPEVANFDVPKVLHGPAAADANLTRAPSGPAAAYFSPSGDSNVPAVGSNQSKSSVCTMEELARVMIRCQGSGALDELEKFNGDPLRYHLFMRQVEDRILVFITGQIRVMRCSCFSTATLGVPGS